MDGTLIIEHPYADLTDCTPGEESFGLSQFGMAESIVHWDWVRYEFCATPPVVVRPSLEEQVAGLVEVVQDLEAPRFVRRWLELRLERVTGLTDGLSQAQELHRIGAHLFLLRMIGMVESPADRVDTLLDFARTTASPEVTREDGYRERIRIVSGLTKTPGLIPGSQPEVLRLFVDIDRNALVGAFSGRRRLGLLARVGVIRAESGEIVSLVSELHPLESPVVSRPTYEALPIDVTWGGEADAGGLVEADDYFMDAIVDLVEYDSGTLEVTRVIDSASWDWELGTMAQALQTEVARSHVGRVMPTRDEDFGWLIMNGRWFVHADCPSSEPGDECDPVLHLLNSDTGRQSAWSDDCPFGMESWIYQGDRPIVFPVRCQDEAGQTVACPDPRGSRDACVMTDFSGQGPRVVVRGRDDASRGLGQVSFWYKRIGNGTITYQRLLVLDQGPVGGSRLAFTGGWDATDELDVIVPSPERAAATAAVRPASSPVVYLLGADGDIEDRVNGNGMGGGARHSPSVPRNPVVVLASGSREPGGVALYLNDAWSAFFGDSDGLGTALELDIGTDPADPDTDRDGILDGFEVLGIRGAGLYPDQALPSWGADPLHKDVFIETDFYNGSGLANPGEPMTPGGAVLMASVAGKCSGGPDYLDNPDGLPGFATHVDNGLDPFDGDGHPLHSKHGNWGGVNGVPKDAWDEYEYGWRHHLRDIRKGVFHYGVGYPGGGGQGVIHGPYFYFGSGNGGPTDSDPGKRAIHELGHNFGLEHFGHHAAGNEFNYKPHYISLMNYAYDGGSPNPEALDPVDRNWDRDNLRFSEGERLYVLDAQGRRTGVERAIDPAAIDEGDPWQDVPSWSSTTAFDLSHGVTGWGPFPWYDLFRWIYPGHRHASLWFDWDRDGDIEIDPGSWTKADVLVAESSAFKLWEFDRALDSGPQLVEYDGSLHVLYVRESRSEISYRIYSEGDDCDPEYIGDVGQPGLPESHQPLCGDWSSEYDIPVSLSTEGDLSALHNPSTGLIDIYYRDDARRLCVLSGAGSSWSLPACAAAGLSSAPSAVASGDRILVFGLGETDPNTGLGPVKMVVLSAADPADTSQWLTWPLQEQIFDEGSEEWYWTGLTSIAPPAMAVDPGDGSLVGITITPEHAMHAIQSLGDTFLYYQRLRDDLTWLDRPVIVEGTNRFSSYSDRRPAFAVERLPDGQPRWHLWLHGDTEGPGEGTPFLRMHSSIVHDEAGYRPIFSTISEATPDGVRQVKATRKSGVSLASYKGKLRAAIGFDVGRGDAELYQGFMFFPLADGVFHAHLEDHDDVRHIGRSMATTLGPLFYGMLPEHQAILGLTNHVLVPGGARSRNLEAAFDASEFDGIRDEGMVDLQCFPSEREILP
ncbi:MAG TPA: hypothetical protein PK668_02080 [Myxococcota bacterium]|nr:hypothetical protein [Myxococcota bacterium]HRY94643.1 hypothetical protein [Myxococcota bacterium]